MFRFTIREVLLLTVIVALGFGWWADRRELVDAHRNTARQLAAEQEWEHRAEVFADALREAGYTVELTPNGSKLTPLNSQASDGNVPSE